VEPGLLKGISSFVLLQTRQNTANRYTHHALRISFSARSSATIFFSGRPANSCRVLGGSQKQYCSVDTTHVTFRFFFVWFAVDALCAMKSSTTQLDKLTATTIEVNAKL
jgi:hypothetical protein